MPRLPRRLYKSTIKRKLKARGAVKTVNFKRLVSEFGQSNFTLQPITVDRNYRIPRRDLFDLILERNEVNVAKYIAEQRDCDDFAWALANDFRWNFGLNCIGMVLDCSGGHAYCCAVVQTTDETDGMKAILIEPQNDGQVTVGESHQYAGQCGFYLI